MRRTRRPVKPARVSEVLADYLKAAGLSARLEQASVIDAWPALVGPEIARVAVPERVSQDGILFVRVKSSAWRQELSLMSRDILGQINRGKREGRIAAIRWVVGDGGHGGTDARGHGAAQSEAERPAPKRAPATPRSRKP